MAFAMLALARQLLAFPVPLPPTAMNREAIPVLHELVAFLFPLACWFALLLPVAGMALMPVFPQLMTRHFA